MKKVSAGVIIHNKTSILVGHVTNQWFWDIPKGLIDQYESPIDAAIREVYEETAFDISEYRGSMMDLGKVRYQSDKDLYLFDLYLEELPDISSLHCDSYCNYPDDPLPEDFPEVDEFATIIYDEMSSYMIPALVNSIKHFYPYSFMDQIEGGF
jgi:8-oxo-dGTP pyrophosphatase MutT (NUDIX family)